MKKSYILDTNILVDDEKCIENLKNGVENKIYIPNTAIEELDKLKDKKPHLKSKIFKVIDEIENHREEITILYANGEKEAEPDNQILNEISQNIKKMHQPVIVSNDKILRTKAYFRGFNTEVYKRQIPFKHESENYTGFIEPYTDDKVNNCFYWDKGKLMFYSKNEEKMINYENEPWKVRPRNHYQNCFLDLTLNPAIDLITVQSEPGHGKTFLALASALYLTLEKKKYKKIYIMKSNYEIGNSLGFLPGMVEEKMHPYFKPIHNLITKLNGYRNIGQKYLDDKNMYGLDPDYIEFIPINYLRGMNIEDCVIICEEIQNLSRSDARSLLSRMGENVKCICTGDINQIDNPYLSKDNNAMNWIVKLFKGEPNYGHIVLKGKNTRGPICQMVVDKNL